MRLDLRLRQRRPPSGSAETDREALVALYNATDGENWMRSDNWLSDAPLGLGWNGVTTNDDGRVTKLILTANGLSGEIPAELGSLSNLDRADPQRQRVERGDTGGAGQPLQPGRTEPQREPVERGDTGGAGQPLQPRISDLAENQLSGEIPAELGSLSNLTSSDPSASPA